MYNFRICSNAQNASLPALHSNAVQLSRDKGKAGQPGDDVGLPVEEKFGLWKMAAKVRTILDKTLTKNLFVSNRTKKNKKKQLTIS